MPRWMYIVECYDRTTGILQRERFMFPADAHARMEHWRRAGMFSVRLYEKRVRATGPFTNTNPGLIQV